jgi:hypothetical protein
LVLFVHLENQHLALKKRLRSGYQLVVVLNLRYFDLIHEGNDAGVGNRVLQLFCSEHLLFLSHLLRRLLSLKPLFLVSLSTFLILFSVLRGVLLRIVVILGSGGSVALGVYFAVDMVFIFGFEFIKGHVSLGLCCLKSLLSIFCFFDLIWDVLGPVISLHIRPPYIESDPLFLFLTVKGVIYELNMALFLDFFKMLHDLFRQGGSLMLLPHLLLNHDIIVSSPLLDVLLGHGERLVVAVFHVLDELAAVSD